VSSSLWQKERAMRRFALFVLPAVLGVTISASTLTQAQDKTVPVSSTRTDDVRPPMTAEQAAELRADILMARKEFAAAIDAYQAILKDKPRDAMLLNKMGVAYQQLGANDSAAAYYKRAEKADKKLSSPVNNLGTLEYGLKHYSKSVNYYKRALTLGAATATVYSNLGYAYYAEKKMDLAMVNFDKAVQLDPSIFDNHVGGSGAVIQQRTAPDPGTFNFMLAKTYAKSGDAERAAHYLKLARDYGYKDLASVNKDKDFAAVLKDTRVQDVLLNRPSFTDVDAKAPATVPATN
jgi:tetratricopeptide (TPR) repeat protein